MENYYTTVQDSSGNIVNGATVTVYDDSTGAVATIYETDGTTALANPFLSGYARSEGEIEFAAANGMYNIKIVNGAETDWIYRISLFEPNAFTKVLLADTTAKEAKDTLQLQIDGLTELRGLTPVDGEILYLKYHTTQGDGGHGVFEALTGAAPGTYTDDNGVIIVPTGGDGSAAWVAVRQNFGTPEMFGGKAGDPAIDNGAIINAAFGVFNTVVLGDGTYYSATTIEPGYGQTLIGTGDLWTGAGSPTIISMTADAPIISLLYDNITIKRMALVGDVLNAANDGIYMPSKGSGATIEKVWINSCGQHGINASGTNTVGIDLCKFSQVKIEGCQGWGFYSNIGGGNGFNTSLFELIECTSNELGGFYVDHAYNDNFIRCHAFRNNNSGGAICHGFVNGANTGGITYTSCWGEANGNYGTVDATYHSNAFEITGGTDIYLISPFVYDSHRGIHVFSGSNINIVNPEFNALGYATYADLYVEGTSVTGAMTGVNYIPGTTIIANLSDNFSIETNNNLPTTGRYAKNTKWRRSILGTAHCYSGGSAALGDYSGTLDGTAGNTYLTYTVGTTFHVGDHIQIPGAGVAGATLITYITDIDLVNSRVYIDTAISTTVVGANAKTIVHGTYSEDRAQSAPASGAYQIGDTVWNSAPTAASPNGWRCSVAGSPGTWVAMANLV